MQHNDFEETVFGRFPALAAARAALEAAGALVARLTGSGSAVFGVFQRRDAAVEAAGRVRAMAGVAAVATAETLVQGSGAHGRRSCRRRSVGVGWWIGLGFRGTAAPPGAAATVFPPSRVAPGLSLLLARRLMVGHWSLEPVVVVRLHPGQSTPASRREGELLRDEGSRT